ncbi:MAG: hypothetical protein QOH61_370 [Chloroflexota bacterium]|nr:hypothetical protein [Chloroflexota bacterium]
MGKKAAKKKRKEREAQALVQTGAAGQTAAQAPPGETAVAIAAADPAAAKVTQAAPVPSDLATRLNSVAIHLLRRLQREDARLGLSAARLSALSVLVFGGPRTLGKLADAEGVSAPSMTRLVTAMEADGLVTRRKNDADGRSVIVHAAPEGERILLLGREQRVAALAGWLESLTPERLASLDTASTVLDDLLRSERPDRSERESPVGGPRGRSK